MSLVFLHVGDSGEADNPMLILDLALEITGGELSILACGDTDHAVILHISFTHCIYNRRWVISYHVAYAYDIIIYLLFFPLFYYWFKACELWLFYEVLLNLLLNAIAGRCFCKYIQYIYINTFQQNVSLLYWAYLRIIHLYY